jgi:hypothetical protein
MFFGLFPSKEWRAFRARYKALEQTFRDNPYPTPTQFNLALSEKYLQKYLAGEGALPHPAIIKGLVTLAVSSYETEVYINSIPKVDLSSETISPEMLSILSRLEKRVRDEDAIYNQTLENFAEFFQKFTVHLPEMARFFFKASPENSISYSLLDILPSDPSFLLNCVRTLHNTSGFFSSLQLPVFEAFPAKDRPENTKAVSHFRQSTPQITS